MLKKHSTWLEHNIGLTKPLQLLIAFFVVTSVFLTVYSALAVTKNEIQSIVQIIVFNDKDEAVSSGSGVVIDGDGDVLTNFHVLQDAIEKEGWWLTVCVTADPKRPPICGYLTVKLMNYSKPLDLALLQFAQIKDKDNQFVDFKQYLADNQLYVDHVKIDRAANAEMVELGDVVQTLGYPTVGGTNITYTKGIVSGFEEMGLDDGTSIPWYIKTDAKVNPGGSGGGAFDTNDNFIGVPSAVSGGPGNIGYVISLPIVNYFLDKTLGSPAAPDAASTSTDITTVPALTDAYCEENVRKNTVFNPATGNCDCKKGLTLMEYECVQKPAAAYFIGVPKSKTDLLNCLVVGDNKTKRYYVRGHRFIKTASYKNKTCYESEAAANLAKLRKAT